MRMSSSFLTETTAERGAEAGPGGGQEIVPVQPGRARGQRAGQCASSLLGQDGQVGEVGAFGQAGIGGAGAAGPAGTSARWASASRVSAVWFRVQSPGVVTTRTGALSIAARSAIVVPAAS